MHMKHILQKEKYSSKTVTLHLPHETLFENFMYHRSKEQSKSSFLPYKEYLHTFSKTEPSCTQSPTLGKIKHLWFSIHFCLQ